MLRCSWRPAAALASFILGASAGFAGETPVAVGHAWERAAVTTAHPQHAVLLGVTRAGPSIVAVGERGLIAVSDDGAKNWTQSAAPTSVTLVAVRFADAQRGYAVGHAGTVLATADGGRTWVRRLDGKRIAEIELSAARASRQAGALKSAERLVADGPDKPLLDLHVFDAQRVLVVGAYGIALATTDGGASWTSWRARLDNPKESHLYAVRRRGERIVIAGEQGLLLQSLDGGASFQRLPSPYPGSWFTVELPSETGLLAAGLRGNVWRSDDLGANWTQLASPVPASITASAPRGDGSIMLASQAGLLLVAAPATGDRLRLVPGPALAPLTGVLPLADGAALALSVHGAQLVPAAAATGQEGVR